MRSALKLLLAAAVCYSSVLLMIPALQRRLTYFPTIAPAEELVAAARRLGLEPWTIDGEIVAWRTPATARTNQRLLIFHGNAGYALHRSYFLPLPPAPESWQVILAEYPGYGARSSGEPSERAFQRTTEVIFANLRAESDQPIFVVGESIGSGVAAWLAGNHPSEVGGMVLITPMPSLADVALHHYPWLPIRRLLRDRYDSVQALRAYRGPIAFVVAENDEIIPAAIGRKLYDAYDGPKRLWIQRGTGHNSIDYDPRWWSPIFAFVQDHARQGREAGA